MGLTATGVPAHRRGACGRRTGVLSDADRLGLVGFGIYHLAIGVFMAIDPGAFFELIGPFGERNDHYVRDVASFQIPLGVALLAAVRQRAWRAPVLAFATLQWTLHALNHLVDIGAAATPWIGAADFVLLAAGAAVLGWLLARAVRAERWAGS